MLHYPFTPRQKTVLLTHCESNNPLSPLLALAFHKAGYLVFASARNASRIPSALRSLLDVVVLELDAADPSCIAEAVGVVGRIAAAAVGGGGGGALDALVYGGGVGGTGCGDVEEEVGGAGEGLEVWRRAFERSLDKGCGMVVDVERVVEERGLGGKEVGAEEVATRLVESVLEERRRSPGGWWTGKGLVSGWK